MYFVIKQEQKVGEDLKEIVQKFEYSREIV